MAGHGHDDVDPELLRKAVKQTLGSDLGVDRRRRGEEFEVLRDPGTWATV